MKQILNGNIPSEVWPNVEVDFYKKVELFIDSMVGYDKYNDTFKIFYVREPEAISKIKEFVIKNHNIFDAILTYDEEILTKCENSFFIPFGTTWIHDYNCYENKVFCVSHFMFLS